MKNLYVVRIGAALIIFVIAFSFFLPYHASVGSSTPGILVPLYAYPGTSWQSVIEAKQMNPTIPIVAIINPSNGPGSSSDPNFVQGIQQLQSAGVTVIGYVHTSYGTRNISSIEGEIIDYKNWYNINGIFFDEMTNVAGFESYYSTLSSYAKSLGLDFTVGNPGGPVPSSYIGIFSCLVIFESSGLPSLSTLASATSGYSPSNFAIISYNVNTVNQTYLSETSQYVSYVYATNANQPDPYNTLTSYFSQLVGVAPTINSTTSPVTLTIQSLALNGTMLSGLSVEVTDNSATVATGFTPLNFSASPGTQYEISVANYKSYVFNHWWNGSTSSTLWITPTQNVVLPVYYTTANSPSTVSSTSSNVVVTTGVVSSSTITQSTTSTSSITSTSRAVSTLITSPTNTTTSVAAAAKTSTTTRSLITTTTHLISLPSAILTEQTTAFSPSTITRSATTVESGRSSSTDPNFTSQVPSISKTTSETLAVFLTLAVVAISVETLMFVSSRTERYGLGSYFPKHHLLLAQRALSHTVSISRNDFKVRLLALELSSSQFIKKKLCKVFQSCRLTYEIAFIKLRKRFSKLFSVFFKSSEKSHL